MWILFLMLGVISLSLGLRVVYRIGFRRGMEAGRHGVLFEDQLIYGNSFVEVRRLSPGSIKKDGL